MLKDSNPDDSDVDEHYNPDDTEDSDGSTTSGCDDKHPQKMPRKKGNRAKNKGSYNTS